MVQRSARLQADQVYPETLEAEQVAECLQDLDTVVIRIDAEIIRTMLGAVVSQFEGIPSYAGART